MIKKCLDYYLTKYCIPGTTRLTGTTIYIEIGMTTGSPLPQYSSPRVHDVDKMSIARI